ncbi:ISY1-like protein [Monocercomonoides exilis]|uniref:ISY1-like protein n=1 Tax=Monocercomonoides exilis TaxID=2049356 RepID=UPI00355A9B2E|nr:ISY1-like protein [Monocercomonoides exilis]|eukprot:MONOS_2083.1-p1 / transcript=MONOS_2083.1 / gene=MONOS_2083 / organism=Monocercomonoides_exilis_PA203 / gene_product=ISY1-like protein / transcript_product=ISY1-like protein / location=Mono_scaffold00041:3708-4490(+) / protein_length=186 / sequence_SO=supercontig / SO=protein_coding / is_pseudo=false
MARSEEKANAMLNRFLKMKAEERQLLQPETRPFSIEECSDLAKAQHWRESVILEISKKTGIIQNESIGEHRIRELNDTINKLLVEKWKWEKRILDLGGPHLLESLEPPKYKFFGAAKNLDGVKELLDKQEAETKKKTRKELSQLVDYEYYGFCDEDDPVLLDIEASAERKIILTSKLGEYQQEIR